MSLLLLTRAVIETARISVSTAAESVLGRPQDMARYDRRIDGWAKRMVKIADIDLRVEGRERIPPDEAFVIMSNHQSHYDVVVLYRVLPLRMRMVAKRELYKWPVFGEAMRVAGFVEVDRSDRRQAVSALRGAREAIASGTSIWIAPEGTRSHTGELGSFKKGGFHLALDAGARILPLAIDGTRHVLRAHDWKIHEGKRVRVTIEEPIDPQDYGAERRAELMEAVRAAIARHLPPS